MSVGFTLISINSYNHWGQLTDDFFLRRCLLSGKLQSCLCNYSIFVILAACKFYWHLLKGNFFFLALASCLSFFGQTFLALVFRPYFQLFLPMGSFWTRSQMANNVWIVLNHVFRRVTSEYCRCTSVIWVLPPAYLVYHFGTEVVNLRPCKLQTLWLFSHTAWRKSMLKLWIKSEDSLTWNKIESFKQYRVIKSKWKDSFQEVSIRSKAQTFEETELWYNFLDLWVWNIGLEFQLSSWGYSLYRLCTTFHNSRLI